LQCSERVRLARDLAQACYLSGTFTLRSGQTSSFYFDKYQFETSPSLLRRVIQQMVPLIPRETEVLAGLELGGVPIATALSLETGIPAAFVRKLAKQYGTCRLAEGVAVEGKGICIVEDVITTGGQVLASANGLRKQGALVTSLVCVIWRAAGQPSLPGIETCRALFTAAELEPSVSKGAR
jgi:orotate phosphoribosyltransferase